MDFLGIGYDEVLNVRTNCESPKARQKNKKQGKKKKARQRNSSGSGSQSSNSPTGPYCAAQLAREFEFVPSAKAEILLAQAFFYPTGRTRTSRNRTDRLDSG